ncbi:conserved Plasmodium protein, unknown function [Plasmodium knowlesi strain H]|uniref:Uncharacterized protein n=3 Tax=Plasmodium knowlesi TaxID=5850 RepID=A0A5K1V1Z0_PLAKH|nr:protein GEXP15, putative [Plasmodium knowlesi strain H]OTN68327.1 Uncharacterized protein PKNOH_S03331100 [Plasmodium knowlesi]CAA9987213.1 protein GEXP15, putative [Plasmodium knowlesi strain H]SBO23979.1 conserved Plasmodium protein, unknown function [Plasmodium knowlesi strain H]SBO25948.1 conserved Plasmodium protein, unknown function [Plasmodium knowlesi strain H]VVS76687.1 protein GEXP15, putative [Plasmodium knowlesi strain H]|eukprot:XP_002261834.1 hypothetical protein, conserved in Plasmodium species [Plasmodium knowlesi strain H]
MLKEESVEVELVKLENEISKGENSFEKKKKKKVQFSDKNETIYYEKDENENSYFNFAVNNFNYFECFYNEMYNCDFDEKEFKAGHSFLNEEDHKGGSYNSLEIFEAKDSSDEGTRKENRKENGIENGIDNAKENGRGRGVVRRGYVAMNTGEDESPDGEIHGESTKGAFSSRDGKNQSLKRERFTHSFNEDSSFEVNDVHAAILNAEERTSHYSEDYFGFNIEPFNMKNELKEGYIDKHGNYIYNHSDGDDFEEAWLKSVDEEDPFTSFSNKKIKAKIHNETVSKFDKFKNQSLNNNSLSVNIYDALYSLSCLLIEKETPIKAMVRYKRDLKLCKNYLNECKLKLDKFRFVSSPRESNESSKDPNVSKSCQGADADRSESNEGKRDEDRRAPVRRSGKKNILQVKLKTRAGDSVGKEGEETLVNEAVDKEVIPNGDTQSEEDEHEGEKSEATPREEHPVEEEEQPREEEPPAKESTEEDNVADGDEEAEGEEKVAEDDKTAEQGGQAMEEEGVAEQGDKAADEEKDALRESEEPNELQRLEETYQKIALDYKTIERRFNNLIDLTQKLTNEYKNVYFLAKHECEALCKKLEESKDESVDIQWQLRWTSDANNNVYGPYNYYDIYNLISVGIVSAENPIQLRRINKENKVLENIWQMYDAVNYLTFVSNENVKKKRKLSETTNQVETKEDGSDEEDNSLDDEYDIKKKKRKKKGLIQISKKKEMSSTNEDDSDNEEDDYENYDY